MCLSHSFWVRDWLIFPAKNSNRGDLPDDGRSTDREKCACPTPFGFGTGSFFPRKTVIVETYQTTAAQPIGKNVPVPLLLGSGLAHFSREKQQSWRPTRRRSLNRSGKMCLSHSFWVRDWLI